MPTRYIKESARTSKNLNTVSDFAERLFWRLITTADDYGRFLACPQIVKSICFPLSDTMKAFKIEQALGELHTAKLIGLYMVGDRHYGWFMNWVKHQGKPRAKESKYPEIPLESVRLPASAGICLQPPTDSLGDPNTNTDTDLIPSSPNPDPKRTHEAEFEDWWKAMPSRGNKKLYKSKAFEFYVRYVRPDERLDAVCAARAYASYCTKEERTPVDPHRFLNGQRGEMWREFVLPISQPVQRVKEEPKVIGPFVPPPPELMGRLSRMGVKIPTVIVTDAPLVKAVN